MLNKFFDNTDRNRLMENSGEIGHRGSDSTDADRTLEVARRAGKRAAREAVGTGASVVPVETRYEWWREQAGDLAGTADSELQAAFEEAYQEQLHRQEARHVRTTEKKPRMQKPSAGYESPHPYQGRMVGESGEDIDINSLIPAIRRAAAQHAQTGRKLSNPAQSFQKKWNMLDDAGAEWAADIYQKAHAQAQTDQAGDDHDAWREKTAAKRDGRHYHESVDADRFPKKKVFKHDGITFYKRYAEQEYAQELEQITDPKDRAKTIELIDRVFDAEDKIDNPRVRKHEKRNVIQQRRRDMNAVAEIANRYGIEKFSRWYTESVQESDAQKASRYHPDSKTYRGSKNRMPHLDDGDPVNTAGGLDSMYDYEAEYDPISGVEHGMDQKRLQKHLNKAMQGLKDHEQQVLKLRFGLDGEKEHTLEQVGEIIGLTREQVRQIESKALRKLRHPSRTADVASYMESLGMAESRSTNIIGLIGSKGIGSLPQVEKIIDIRGQMDGMSALIRTTDGNAYEVQIRQAGDTQHSELQRFTESAGEFDMESLPWVSAGRLDSDKRYDLDDFVSGLGGPGFGHTIRDNLWSEVVIFPDSYDPVQDQIEDAFRAHAPDLLSKPSQWHQTRVNGERFLFVMDRNYHPAYIFRLTDRMKESVGDRVEPTELTPMQQFHLVNDHLGFRVYSGVKLFRNNPEAIIKFTSQFTDQEVQAAIQRLFQLHGTEPAMMENTLMELDGYANRKELEAQYRTDVERERGKTVDEKFHRFELRYQVLKPFTQELKKHKKGTELTYQGIVKKDGEKIFQAAASSPEAVRKELIDHIMKINVGKDLPDSGTVTLFLNVEVATDVVGHGEEFFVNVQNVNGVPAVIIQNDPAPGFYRATDRTKLVDRDNPGRNSLPATSVPARVAKAAGMKFARYRLGDEISVPGGTGFLLVHDSDVADKSEKRRMYAPGVTVSPTKPTMEARSDSLKRRLNKAFWWDGHSSPADMQKRIRSYTDQELISLVNDGIDDHQPGGDGTPRAAQIKLIKRELKRRFGVSPRGKLKDIHEQVKSLIPESQLGMDGKPDPARCQEIIQQVFSLEDFAEMLDGYPDPEAIDPIYDSGVMDELRDYFQREVGVPKSVSDSMLDAHILDEVADCLGLDESVTESKMKTAAAGLALAAALWGGAELTSAKHTPLGQALQQAAQAGDQEAAHHLKKLDLYTEAGDLRTLEQLRDQYL